MKLLYVATAKAMWIFDLNLLNPKGLSLHGVIDSLKEKYKFSKAPAHPLDVNEEKALAFQLGTFINSQNQPISITFKVFNNGFAADSLSSTRDSDEFLREISAWLVKDYGFLIPPEDKLQKAYLSQLDVQCDVPLVALNPKLEAFAQTVSAASKAADGKPRKFEIGAVNLWPEDINQPLAPAVFRYERRWGVPFANNQYFSQAPMETHKHLEVLEDLEKLLKP
jgi:hypothetical protein